MPDISTELDLLAEQIAEKVGLAQEEIMQGLLELVKDKNAEEAMAILSQVKIDSLMTMKLSGAFALYRTGVIKLLESTVAPTLLSESTLNSLLIDSERWLAKEFIDKSTIAIRQGIVKGIANNKFPNEIIEGLKSNLEELGLSKRQMETLVNSGYSQYSNAVTNMMGEKLPDNTMYIYIGAYDNKTRLACERKIQDSPASKENILNKYGNLDNEIWNCRHKWEPIDPKSTSRDIQAQGYEEKKSA